MNEKLDVIIFEDEELKLEVRVSPEEDTVWLTQRQMAKLFDVSVDNISLHIKNIFNEKELEQDSTTEESSEVQMEGNRSIKRNIKVCNLDVIISVGYRVKSKRGIIFRKWANSILKEHIYKGFVVDQQRLITNDINYKAFTSTIKLIADLVKRKQLNRDESNGLLNVISKYPYALDTLDKYDHQTLTIRNVTKDNKQNKLEYGDAMKEIQKMPDYGKSQ